MSKAFVNHNYWKPIKVKDIPNPEPIKVYYENGIKVETYPAAKAY